MSEKNDTFIYLGLHIVFNTVQVISQWLLFWAQGSLKVLYCKLPTIDKQLPAFQNLGFEPPTSEVGGTFVTSFALLVLSSDFHENWRSWMSTCLFTELKQLAVGYISTSIADYVSSRLEMGKSEFVFVTTLLMSLMTL